MVNSADLLKPPPQDIEAEIAIIGAMLIDEESIKFVERNLKPSDFYKNAHGDIVRAFFELRKEEQVCDVLTVTSKLKAMDRLDAIGGHAYISEIMVSAMTSANIESHIRLVKEAAVKRRALRFANDITNQIYHEDISASDIALYAVDSFKVIGQESDKLFLYNSDEVIQMYDHLRITRNVDVPDIIPYIKIGNSTISTPANICVLSGESKSSKSALMNVMIAGAIYQDDLMAEGFKDLYVLKNKEKFGVVHIDTEQSSTIHKARYQGILNRAALANKEPDYFYSYNIRQLDIDDYKTVTSRILDAVFEKHKGLHFIFIDGIADYIKSVNDEETANDIVHYFEQISIKYNCPVVTVIHLNPNSESKQRGHLGSQLQRKAESVIIIRKDKSTGISHCEYQHLRNAGEEATPKIQFKFEPQKGYHIYAGEFIDDKANELDKIKYVLQEVFAGAGEMSRKDAKLSIMQKLGVSERTAEDKLRQLEEFDFVKKVEPDNRKSKLIIV